MGKQKKPKVNLNSKGLLKSVKKRKNDLKSVMDALKSKK